MVGARPGTDATLIRKIAILILMTFRVKCSNVHPQNFCITMEIIYSYEKYGYVPSSVLVALSVTLAGKSTLLSNVLCSLTPTHPCTLVVLRATMHQIIRAFAPTIAKSVMCSV